MISSFGWWWNFMEVHALCPCDPGENGEWAGAAGETSVCGSGEGQYAPSEGDTGEGPVGDPDCIHQCWTSGGQQMVWIFLTWNRAKKRVKTCGVVKRIQMLLSTVYIVTILFILKSVQAVCQLFISRWFKCTLYFYTSAHKFKDLSNNKLHLTMQSEPSS